MKSLTLFKEIVRKRSCPGEWRCQGKREHQRR